jgi:hypothetical protein
MLGFLFGFGELRDIAGQRCGMARARMTRMTLLADISSVTAALLLLADIVRHPAMLFYTNDDPALPRDERGPGTGEASGRVFQPIIACWI